MEVRAAATDRSNRPIPSAIAPDLAGAHRCGGVQPPPPPPPSDGAELLEAPMKRFGLNRSAPKGPETFLIGRRSGGKFGPIF